MCDENTGGKPRQEARNGQRRSDESRIEEIVGAREEHAQAIPAPLTTSRAPLARSLSRFRGARDRRERRAPISPVCMIAPSRVSARPMPSRASGYGCASRISTGHVRAVAAWLSAQGYGRGDRIAVMMPNVMAYPAILFGILKAGCVVVNVNPLYTVRELRHQITDSGAKVLFVLENFAHTVERSDLAKAALEHVVLVAPGDLLGLKGHLVNCGIALRETRRPAL